MTAALFWRLGQIAGGLPAAGVQTLADLAPGYVCVCTYVFGCLGAALAEAVGLLSTCRTCAYFEVKGERLIAASAAALRLFVHGRRSKFHVSLSRSKKSDGKYFSLLGEKLPVGSNPQGRTRCMCMP